MEYETAPEQDAFDGKVRSILKLTVQRETPEMPEGASPILREIPAELVGERVLLRPYRPGDGAQLWEAIEESREHHLPWIPWGAGHKLPADSEESARRMQVRWLLREDLPLGIWERATGRYLGAIN